MSPCMRWAAVALCLFLRPGVPASGAATGNEAGSAAGLPRIPRFSPAEPSWLRSLQACGVSFASLEAYSPLIQALRDSGLTLEKLEASPALERKARIEEAAASLRSQVEPLAAPLLASASVLSPESAGEQTLRAAYEELRYLGAALSPYLEEGTLRKAKAVFAPIQQEAGKRKLIDIKTRILRTAEALGPPGAEELVPGSSQASGTRLSRAGQAQEQGHVQLSQVSRMPRNSKEAKTSLAARTGKALRLAAFSGLLVGFFQGQPPVVASDMDHTLTAWEGSMEQPMAKAIADILRAGGRYGILSGAAGSAVLRQVVKPLMEALGERRELLSRLVLGSHSGAKIYGYSLESASFEPIQVVDLASLASSEGTQDGIEKIRMIVEEASLRFDFEGEMRRLLGKGLQGEILSVGRSLYRGSEVTTQVTLVATGKDISPEDKELYDLSGGRSRRKAYAAFINRRLREEGIPLEARVAGRTSIDIGVNKGYGLKAVAAALGASPGRMVWAGDSHESEGNDRPAAELAGIVIHVGPPLSENPGRITFSEENGGPGSLLAYYRILAGYLRAVAWLRGSHGSPAPRGGE